MHVRLLETCELDLEPELADSLEEGFLEAPSTNAERLTRQILAVFPEQVEQHKLYGVIEDRSEACRAQLDGRGDLTALESADDPPRRRQ